MPLSSSQPPSAETHARQYLLGVAHFNGDSVRRDWVRAYALTSLAQQAGVPQAKGALAQMDRYVPLEQRQQAAALAPELASRAEATRARQLAAVDLGAPTRTTTMSETARSRPAPLAAARPAPGPAAVPPSAARQGTRDTAELAEPIARVTADDTPRTAGADYARPQVATRTAAPAPSPRPTSPAVAAAPAPTVMPHHTISPSGEASKSRMAGTVGGWTVQLGAFSVAGNADALWRRVSQRRS
jgi:hypothetical protein